MVTSLRLLFFGTPSFAVPSLRTLAGSSHQVAKVVTQPDRRRGRGQRSQPSPVKHEAAQRGIPVLQPERVKSPELLDELRKLSPDLGVVVAYGQILPASLLQIPRMGFVNVHASLLPRWRGAAPIHRAVMAGDGITGITIMRVVEALDAGPMLARVETPIAPDETSGALATRLAELGASLLMETVNAMARGPVLETPQDEALATYAKRLTKAEGVIDWTRDCLTVHNQIRGLHPWPGAATVFRGRRLLVRQASPVPEVAAGSPPGIVIGSDGGTLLVATGSGAVQLHVVQLEGRPTTDIAAFLRGHVVAPGERLGAQQAP